MLYNVKLIFKQTKMSLPDEMTYYLQLFPLGNELESMVWSIGLIYPIPHHRHHYYYYHQQQQQQNHITCGYNIKLIFISLNMY